MSPSAPSAPQLMPIAPPPVVVLDASRTVPTEAKVVPPAPHIVKASANTIVVPSSGDGNYQTSEASVTSPLQVNSSYGYRWGRKHTGIDFQASWGDAVGVSKDGTVTFAGTKHGYGNLVIVDHGGGVSTYYAHLSSIYVGVGQALTARQVIGAIGTTGHSTGPHLHYEVRLNGKPINPNSLVTEMDGQFLVNGVPFGDEPAATPAATTPEPTSSLDTSRPRRVSQITTTVLLYGENSLTAY